MISLVAGSCNTIAVWYEMSVPPGNGVAVWAVTTASRVLLCEADHAEVYKKIYRVPPSIWIPSKSASPGEASISPCKTSLRMVPELRLSIGSTIYSEAILIIIYYILLSFIV